MSFHLCFDGVFIPKRTVASPVSPSSLAQLAPTRVIIGRPLTVHTFGGTVLWRPPSVSKSFPDSPISFHSFNGPQLSMTSIMIPPEREYRYLLAMRECDFDLLESPSSLFD